MQYLMLCAHKTTKLKLVSWATWDRVQGHQQGFKRVECCATCGCVVNKEDKVANKNGVHHVLRRPLEYGEGKSYCGRTVFRFDMPIDLDHAKRCIEQETYLQPCKKCMKAANKP